MEVVYILICLFTFHLLNCYLCTPLYISLNKHFTFFLNIEKWVGTLCTLSNIQTQMNVRREVSGAKAYYGILVHSKLIKWVKHDASVTEKKSSHLVLAVNHAQMRCISHTWLDLGEMYFENNVVSRRFKMKSCENIGLQHLMTTCCGCCNPIIGHI